MRTAAAEVAGQPLLYLFEVRLGRPIEKRLRRHDHAVGAIAALGGLFRDESGLQRVGFLRRSESFESGDRTARDLSHGSDTGANGLSFEEYRAGAALG